MKHRVRPDDPSQYPVPSIHMKGIIMKYSTLLVALVTVFGLSACDKPTVVNVPAAPVSRARSCWTARRNRNPKVIPAPKVRQVIKATRVKPARPALKATRVNRRRYHRGCSSACRTAIDRLQIRWPGRWPASGVASNAYYPIHPSSLPWIVKARICPQNFEGFFLVCPAGRAHSAGQVRYPPDTGK